MIKNNTDILRVMMQFCACLEQEPLMKTGHSAATFIAQVNGDRPMDILNV
jgi:hypothetical protein